MTAPRRAGPPAGTLVGCAKVDITPPVGVELGGFGPFLRRRATAIRAPIWVRAIAVESGGTRWVLASCDLLGIDAAIADRAAGRVALESGLPAGAVCIHATHNHSGPAVLPEFIGWGAVDDRYYALLPERIAIACRRALDDLMPATLSSAAVALPGFSFNRVISDQPAPDEVMRVGPERIEMSTDEIDEQVRIIRIDRLGGRSVCVVHYACHPVICCERTTSVHGDFVGIAIARLEQELPETFALFLQGAMGDVNPLYAHGSEAQSYEALDLFADRLHNAMRGGLDAASPAPTAPATSARIRITPSTRAPDGSERRSPPLVAQSLRLGAFTITAFDLELFHGLQRAHHAEFGDNALLLSTSNGYSGYGPTRAAFDAARGRYATDLVPRYIGRDPFTPDIEDELLAAARRAVTSVSLAATDRMVQR